MEKELWHHCEVPYTRYEVSNLGRVRNSKTGHILIPFIDKDQTYERVCIHDGGRQRKVMVHTLVAEAFIGPKPKGY